MDTTATNHPEPNIMADAQPVAQAKAAKTEAQPRVADKFAEARLAKKRQKRRAHRATIRRSNTSG